MKFIGAATAAYQVEGNNIHSDSWVVEQLPNTSYKERSGIACNHFNRYKEDIKIMADHGLNAYRFSIEWGRIQPQKDIFDQRAIDHYIDVVDTCIEHNIEPMITLHHFTSPIWLISEGGWESEAVISYFKKYVDKVTAALGPKVTYYCTINEANMGTQLRRIIVDRFSKMNVERSLDFNDVQVGINILNQTKMSQSNKEAAKAFNISMEEYAPFLAPRSIEGEHIIMLAHQEARKVIKKNNPNAKVGLTLSLYDYQYSKQDELEALLLIYEDLLQYLPFLREDDFLGVQNYTRKIIGNLDIENLDEKIVADSGNEFYPKSLEHVIRLVSTFWKKEILVTENGVSTKDDTLRVKLIEEVFSGFSRLEDEGIKVEGYLHWSLLDNFEWQLGYSQKFGLISFNKRTMEQEIKPSLIALGNIAKEYNKKTY